MSDHELDIETATTRTGRIAGHNATFGTDENAIYIELQVGRPSYIHVEEGHYLQEGDAFHRNQLGMTPPTIATWEVVAITPDEVVGRDMETGEETTWDREAVEQRLAVGTYSTNLTDFERLSIHQVRSPPSGDEGSDHIYRYTGPPYVAVVAYGDNGLQYGRRYRFVDEEKGILAIWTQDEPVERLGEEVRNRLDHRVRVALETDGYSVVETG